MKKVYVWLASLFVSFALVSMGVMASAESVAQAPADVISEDVSFANTDSGLTLSGILYTPAEMTRDALNPAIIVTGPMLSVYASRDFLSRSVTAPFCFQTSADIFISVLWDHAKYTAFLYHIHIFFTKFSHSNVSPYS